MPPKAGSSHDEIIRNVLQPEQGRWRSWRSAACRPPISPACARTGRDSRRRRSHRGQRAEGARNYLLLYGAKNETALQRARAGIQEAEASFRPLSNADLAAARPWTIRTVPFPRGGFAQIARQSPLGGNAEAQLRLINGAYSGGQPQPEQLVKAIK